MWSPIILGITNICDLLWVGTNVSHSYYIRRNPYIFYQKRLCCSFLLSLALLCLYCLGAAKKNQINHAPMCNFHSLSTYLVRTNFKIYFPRQLGHSYFLFPRVFMFFFHWNSLGPVEISYGFGGDQNECFSLIEHLTFQLNSFSQKLVHTKNWLSATRKELTIPNNFSSSLNSICMRI
jgi:hypothetical protein